MELRELDSFLSAHCRDQTKSAVKPINDNPLSGGVVDEVIKEDAWDSHCWPGPQD